jgi:hypothetical protein
VRLPRRPAALADDVLIRPLAVVASTDVEALRIIVAIVVLVVALSLFSRPRAQRWYR